VPGHPGEDLVAHLGGLAAQQRRERDALQERRAWKAVQTQAWKQEAGADTGNLPEPTFSFRAINYLVRLLTAHDASWDAYFLGLGIAPLQVTYEELAEDPDPVIRRVLHYLEIPTPPDLRIDAPRLSVQADERSEEWIRRVHDHLAALEAPDAVVAGT
jgi:LPS sulfotransferase NodH